MRTALRLAAFALPSALATPAFAEMLASATPHKIDAGDTAWMIAATGLVLMMTIPGLALFYAGMVRKKNVLATMAQSVAAVALVSILWALLGYTLAFSGDAPALGNLERAFLHGIGMDTVSPLAKTIPESLFMIYQMTFAIITVALVAGAVADRMRFSAFLLFSLHLAVHRLRAARALGLGRRLPANLWACSISPAARWCTSMRASPDSSPRSCSASGAATARRISRRTICRWR